MEQSKAIELAMLSTRMRRLLGAEVFEQAGEGGLEGVVLLPVREVGDEVFAQLDSEILAAVRIEALPVAPSPCPPAARGRACAGRSGARLCAPCAARSWEGVKDDVGGV